MRITPPRLVLPILLALLGAPAAGQSPSPIPDPFAGQTGTYQTDPSRPAQTELRDCHLFEAISWGWGTDSLRSRMRMSCQYLARMGPGGSDRDRATAAALRAFEAGARAHLARIDEALARSEPEGAPPRSGSLVIRNESGSGRAGERETIEPLTSDHFCSHVIHGGAAHRNAIADTHSVVNCIFPCRRR